ncbi:RrF2 family transcriptional regulator [Roseomonas cutis]|uniref:RrF2 family transcriptional regulator n=1 Tax=Roseomonas cutis TaxID=2897332 RepID=UPI00351D5775
MTDYAVAVLARLGEARPGDGQAGESRSGERQDALRTAPDLAAATGLGEPTVAKILKMLSQACLVEGLRGARGGYRLTRPLDRIAVAEVIVAMDGPIALTACVDGASGACDAEALCPVRGRWDPVNDAIRHALSGITLADLSGPTCHAHHAAAPVAEAVVPARAPAVAAAE